MPIPIIRNRTSQGSTLIEFALAAPLCFLLLLAAFDFCLMLYSQQTLQSAVSEAARFGITGQRLPDPDDPTVPLSRGASIRAVFERYAVALDRRQIDLRLTDGGPRATLDLRARYPYPWLLPGLLGQRVSVTLEGRATLRNEPFPEDR